MDQRASSSGQARAIAGRFGVLVGAHLARLDTAAPLILRDPTWRAMRFGRRRLGPGIASADFGGRAGSVPGSTG